jgi:hypothetical protein
LPHRRSRDCLSTGALERGSLRSFPRHIVSIHKPVQSQTNKGQSDARDACLPRFHAEARATFQYSCTLFLQILLTSVETISSKANKCCSTCDDEYKPRGETGEVELPVTLQAMQSSSLSLARMLLSFSGCWRLYNTACGLFIGSGAIFSTWTPPSKVLDRLMTMDEHRP